MGAAISNPRQRHQSRPLLSIGKDWTGLCSVVYTHKLTLRCNDHAIWFTCSITSIKIKSRHEFNLYVHTKLFQFVLSNQFPCPIPFPFPDAILLRNGFVIFMQYTDQFAKSFGMNTKYIHLNPHPSPPHRSKYHILDVKYIHFNPHPAPAQTNET